MFLAPLNYDRFFKKVFSDLEISKAFLESFLDVEITSIELLENTKRFTDKAAIVEFDFRVKIDEQYLIIDMQQWYKPDVAQRFFLYHALNTGLQLENLPQKKLIMDKSSGKTIEIKDYRRLEPVTTLVWMVDDTLGFDMDYVSYGLLPHTVSAFLRADQLWKDEHLKRLLQARLDVIKDIENDTKGMTFLGQNSLTFIFQKNIVKNPKIEPYKDWFLFAERTKNPENTAADFSVFRENKVFDKIIERINQEALSQNDIKYIHDEDELNEEIRRWEEGKLQEGRQEGRQKGRQEGKKEKQVEIATNLIDILDDVTIAKKTGLSLNEVTELRKQQMFNQEKPVKPE